MLVIKQVLPLEAKQICESITETLPEWFGIAEANERYAQGMLTRTSFAACLEDKFVGLVTLEFPYPNNANIYWMGVKKDYHHRGIGSQLIRYAENYCREHKFTSLTVETLSPKHNNINYNKTYVFYEKFGFKPLFELSPYDPELIMVYMQKPIGFGNFKIVDLTHTLSSEIPTWDGSCGFRNKIITDYPDCSSHTKFRVQRINMHAGIGTHIDAPAHCISGGITIENISLRELIIPGVVINIANKAHENYQISLQDIQEFETAYGNIPQNVLVIFHTGWSQFWQEPNKYRNNFPSVSKEVAEILLERKVCGLAIDTLSPDLRESNFPVHELILGAGKYIIENIANATSLPPIGAHIIVSPLKIKEGTESPLRVIGLVPQP